VSMTPSTPFFDHYPHFYNSSKTSTSAVRLAARHIAIIKEHQELLAGRRVLDLASHDGRWAFAAIHAGAAHVTGIEARNELVENARSNFARYEVDPNRYDFIVGDIFKTLSEINLQVDVVLCLGFFYHSLRHVELLDLIDRTGANVLILDTEIISDQSSKFDTPQYKLKGAGGRKIWEKPVSIQLIEEPVDHESMAFRESATRSDHALVARPSLQYLDVLLDHFGFSASRGNWATILSSQVNTADLRDYAEGWRDTFLCTRRR
jgi:hypothetical protein